MRIDPHLHLGTCSIFGQSTNEEQLLAAMEKNGIDKIIVQNYPGDPSGYAVAHDRIARFIDQYPGKIYGMISVNPHIPEADFHAEVKRCMENLHGFVGIKLHTMGHTISPNNKDADKVFRLANDYGIPIMIHTGTGAPYALPSLSVVRAMEFPNLKIVLAHAGYCVYAEEALSVARIVPNLFLETSWTQPHVILGMIRTLGAGRVMMASDLPINLPTEITKATSIGLTDDEQNEYMGGTADKIFKLV